MSVLSRLTEGIVRRDMRKEGAALVEKWKKTGLLEGLRSEEQVSRYGSLIGEPSQKSSHCSKFYGCWCR